MTALEECIQHTHPAMAVTKKQKCCKQQCGFAGRLFLRAFGRDVLSRFNPVSPGGNDYNENGAKNSTWRTEKCDTSAHSGFSTIETRCDQRATRAFERRYRPCYASGSNAGRCQSAGEARECGERERWSTGGSSSCS